MYVHSALSPLSTISACREYNAVVIYTGFLVLVVCAIILGVRVWHTSPLTMYGNTIMKDTQLVVAFSDGGDAAAQGGGKQLHFGNCLHGM